MKTVGIIAEFNPFHNGHQYLLAEARKMTGADYCVVVMSGDFLQRGGPAMTGKHLRARMALLNGADLVLELPVCYATGSAGYFAAGAVTLLEKIGVTDVLCFGSECGDIRPLLEAARLLHREGAGFKALLKKYLKQGLSFPAARLKAFETAAGTISLPPGSLSSPNDILGLEYCLALRRLNSGIMPLTLRRSGADYHDTRLSPAGGSSASAIRHALETGGTAALSSPTPEADSAAALIHHAPELGSAAALIHHAPELGSAAALIRQSVPANVLPLLIPPTPRQSDFSAKDDGVASVAPGQTIIREEDFSQLLRYKLLLEADTGYTRYLDINEDLSAKIAKNLYSFTGFRELVKALKSRDVTYSRISRCLFHILLDITAADLAAYRAEGLIFYARMLGFRRSAGELLHQIKKHSALPLISKPANAPALLTGIGLRMFQQDIQTAHLYDIVYATKYGLSPVHEYTRQLVRT